MAKEGVSSFSGILFCLVPAEGFIPTSIKKYLSVDAQAFAGVIRYKYIDVLTANHFRRFFHDFGQDAQPRLHPAHADVPAGIAANGRKNPIRLGHEGCREPW